MTKERALEELEYRKAHKPKQIDNSALPAGSAMFYYCYTCGAVSEVLPETHNSTPNHVCERCQFLKNQGWLPNGI